MTVTVRAAKPVKVKDVLHLVHGRGAINSFNTKVAVGLTTAVGTMWCAYGFALLALVGFPGFLPPIISQYVQWVSQTFIQLTLLSVIMVGGAVQSAHADARAEQTFNDTEAILQKIEINTDITNKILGHMETTHVG